jgi:hypothetical protein
MAQVVQYLSSKQNPEFNSAKYNKLYINETMEMWKVSAKKY